MAEVLTVKATVKAPLAKVWERWNDSKHVIQWNSPSPDWHTPKAENDFRPGGKFNYRMEAKDGSFGFDFSGAYDEIVDHKTVRFHLDDDRKVEVLFKETADGVEITESFEAETENSLEIQQMGWQAIMDSFKKYCESEA